MTPLTITLKKKIKHRLDLRFLTCGNFKTITSLKSFYLQYGNSRMKLSELFSIRGKDLKNIIIKSSSNMFDNVGYQMNNMDLTIYGNTGYSLGKEMISGTLKLYGNTSDNACSGINGGQVYIMGNAGNYFCSKPVGLNEGMRDGFVFVKGSIGDNSIERMRRGTIVINGNVGSKCAYQMISGTIVIKGKINKDFCKEGKRGTIVTRDRKIKSLYNEVSANQDFIWFFIKKIRDIYNINVISQNNTIKRFFGDKSSSNMIEVFLVR